MSSRTGLMDVTNAVQMDKAPTEPVKMRAHTRFDDDGNATTEYETIEVQKSAVAEESNVDEEAVVEVEAEEEEAAEEVEAEVNDPKEDKEVSDDKLRYRDVPSLFNDEKSRNAKWCGKHTRFPDDGEDGAEPAETTPEMQKEVEKLVEALPKAM